MSAYDAAEQVQRIFPKRRVRLIVEVSLDPVPGWGYDPEDYRALTQRLLNDAIGHYDPVVEFDGEVTA